MTKTRWITTMAVLSAMGIALPLAAHYSGVPGLGSMLLPLHLMALIAGFWLDAKSGAIVGMASVLGSFLISGMPAFPLVAFFLAQVTLMGLLAGVSRDYIKGDIRRMYAALVIVQLIGWVVCGTVFDAGFAWVAMVKNGVVGIVIQWIIVPPIVRFLDGKISKDA